MTPLTYAVHDPSGDRSGSITLTVPSTAETTAHSWLDSAATAVRRSMANGSTGPPLSSLWSPRRFTRPGAETTTAGPLPNRS
jgi:hypothetical protein